MGSTLHFERLCSCRYLLHFLNILAIYIGSYLVVLVQKANLLWSASFQCYHARYRCSLRVEEIGYGVRNHHAGKVNL